MRIAFAAPSCLRLLPAGGADPADIRLIDDTWVTDTTRYGRVVVASGEHRFTDLVVDLTAGDTEVWVAGYHFNTSRRLVAATHRVIDLTDVSGRWRPDMATNDQRPIHCKEPMVPIVYGMPGPELLHRDDIELGGCVIFDDMPRYRCGRCGATAGRIDNIEEHMADDWRGGHRVGPRPGSFRVSRGPANGHLSS